MKYKPSPIKINPGKTALLVRIIKVPTSTRIIGHENTYQGKKGKNPRFLSNRMIPITIKNPANTIRLFVSCDNLVYFLFLFKCT